MNLKQISILILDKKIKMRSDFIIILSLCLVMWISGEFKELENELNLCNEHMSEVFFDSMKVVTENKKLKKIKNKR